MNDIPLNERTLDLIAKRFRMLGEPYRLRILQQLQTGEKTVGELVESLDGNQPNVSKHLQLLYDAGLVGRRREGNSIFYSISDPIVFRLCDLVCRSEAQKSKNEFERWSNSTSQRERSASRGAGR